MKKLLTFMIVWTCLLTLAGCGKKDMDYTMQNESSVAESVRETGEESVLIQNEDAGEGENAAPETKYITIDLSGVGEIHPKGDAVSPLTLKIVSEEENGIDFANEWYESKQLSLPMVGKEWNNFYDDEYQYICPGMRCIFMKIFPEIVCMCWSIQRINGISTAIMPASWMISFMASV